MKPIEESWKEYKRSAYPDGVREGESNRAREAFMLGASAAYLTIVGKSESTGTDRQAELDGWINGLFHAVQSLQK